MCILSHKTEKHHGIYRSESSNTNSFPQAHFGAEIIFGSNFEAIFYRYVGLQLRKSLYFYNHSVCAISKCRLRWIGNFVSRIFELEFAISRKTQVCINWLNIQLIIKPEPKEISC